MNFINELNLIYNNLYNLKFDMFCGYNGYSKEHHIIAKVVSNFLDKDISINGKHDDNHKYLSLTDLLIDTIEDIKEGTCCDKNYGYLLQLDRATCILKNLEKLFCQLKCFSIKDCDLLAATLCSLFEIVELISNLISKINNMEHLCKGHLCCKDEIEKCILCLMTEDVNNLEDRVSDLGHLVLKIASLNIINCTACTTSPVHVHKERSYMNEYIYTPKSTNYLI